MKTKISEVTVQTILEFKCPRYSELPTIGLYKDQVISYIETALKPLTANTTEKLLTPTMLNNYVKQKVVSPPKGRRYEQKHLAYLIVVCILKQVYTISEVCELIQIQINTCEIEEAYDYFCVELEKALVSVFKTRDFSEESSAKITTFESELLRSTTLAFAHKLYVQDYLYQEKNKM